MKRKPKWLLSMIFWKLLVIYGLLVSIGVGGASNVAATVIVTNWFHKKRGLALEK